MELLLNILRSPTGPVRARRCVRICVRVGVRLGCVRCACVDGHIAHRRMGARVRAGVRTRAHIFFSAVSAESDAGNVPLMALLNKALRSPAGLARCVGVCRFVRVGA
jgi:hypothetical protein